MGHVSHLIKRFHPKFYVSIFFPLLKFDLLFQPGFKAPYRSIVYVKESIPVCEWGSLIIKGSRLEPF